MKKFYLPHVDEFILDLSNNNYSIETVKNYKRDLGIFKTFLEVQEVRFSQITKKTITLYKGFLKSGDYYEFLSEIDEKARNDNKNQKSRPRVSRYNEDKSRRLCSRSINRLLSSLRSYLSFLIDFDYHTPIAPDGVKLI